MQGIAIIGAGPAGCAVMRAFENHTKLFKITVFEKQKSFGGLWNFNPEINIGSDGELVHNGMYQHLVSNSPRECLEFPDFNFEDCFGKKVSSFPPRAVIRKYLERRYVTEKNMKNVRFQTVVRSVTFNDNTNKFSVISYDLNTKKESPNEEFDFVFVCTGHYSHPFTPDVDNINNFQGQILHSHDFRNPEDFKNKTVITVGSSYSAEDIASLCYKFGAKKVYASARDKPSDYLWSNYKWPQDGRIENAGIIKELDTDGKTVIFKTTENYPLVKADNVDAIIFCTGYRHNYSFLEKNMQLNPVGSLYPDTLFNGIYWNDNPNLMYIGAQTQLWSFPFFEIQAMHAREVLLGNIKLPKDKADRRDSIISWLSKLPDNYKFKPEQSIEANAIWFQAHLMEHWLTELKDCPSNISYFKNISDVSNVFGQIRLNFCMSKVENIMTFRDKSHFYIDKNTGDKILTTVIPLKEDGLTPLTWLENEDDSFDGFMKSLSSCETK